MTKKNCKDNIKSDSEIANYICKKCGSTAKKEKHLCKPKEIKK